MWVVALTVESSDNSHTSSTCFITLQFIFHYLAPANHQLLQNWTILLKHSESIFKLKAILLQSNR